MYTGGVNFAYVDPATMNAREVVKIGKKSVIGVFREERSIKGM